MGSWLDSSAAPATVMILRCCHLSHEPDTSLRCIPHMVIMAPSNENEARQMLYTGYLHKGPAAVRYPRGKGPGAAISKTMQALPLGKGLQRRRGHTVAILAFGSLVSTAMAAAEVLDATVIDMRFVKPLDEDMIGEMATRHHLLVTLEEHALMGGAGSAVNDYLLREDYRVPVLNLGLPDSFLSHGKVPDMLASVGLDKDSVVAAIRTKLQKCKIQSEAV